MIYGNSGCSHETHTSCTSCCMGLSTTPPVSIKNFKCTLSLTQHTKYILRLGSTLRLKGGVKERSTKEGLFSLSLSLSL